jgi:peptide/nickel transport system substrate-binding protein
MFSFIVNTNNFSSTQNEERYHDDLININDNTYKTYKNNLIVGATYGPNTIDPHNALAQISFNVIDQVIETLYTYDLGDPNLPIIPRLASDYGTWSPDGLNYTIPLNSGITFHDGSPFNASTVQWNFDRLNWFLNVSGTLWDNTSKTIMYELYEWPDGTPIINRVEVINSNTVRFILNRKFGAFKDLLCFSGSGILSPSSTSSTEYIALSTGNVVGTGPYMYDHYIMDTEVKLHAYENYWRGMAMIENITFSIIQNSDSRNLALLLGDIDTLVDPNPSYYDTMSADPDTTLVEVGANLYPNHIGFNNEAINKTWRQAMSYAIDYDYMIDELLEGEAQRMASPLPYGIKHAKNTYDVATLNLTKARQIMNSMGYGIGYTTDAQWEAASFRTVNFTYNIGNTFREDLLVLLENNLAKIGIHVDDGGLEWDPYLDALYDIGDLSAGWDGLQLWMISWTPDYNDPSTIVNNLMSNTSRTNNAQINDPVLEGYMQAGLEETNDTAREIIYDNLQQYVVEDLMPWAFGYQYLNKDAYNSKLLGYQSNAFDKQYFYTCHWERSNYTIEISEPLDFSYYEGTFGNTITWTVTALYNITNPNYYLWRNSSIIANDNWTAGVPITINIDGLTNGTYIYDIAIYNGDIVEFDSVVIQVLPSRDAITGLPIGILMIISIISISFLMHKKKVKMNTLD